MELTSVTRIPLTPRPRTGPGWVFVGRFLPTDKTEHIRLFSSAGPWTAQLMTKYGHRFASIGGGPQRPAVVDGMAAFCDARVVADPENLVNRDRKLLKVVEKMDAGQAARLKSIIDRLPSRDAGGNLPGEGQDQAAKLQEEARGLCQELPALTSVLPVVGTPQSFVAAAEAVRTILFVDLPEMTANALTVRARTQLATTGAGVETRTRAINQELPTFAYPWTTLSLTEQNADGKLPEYIDLVNCPNAESLLAAHHPELMRLIQDLDLPSVNLVVAEPIMDVRSLHELEGYFDVQTQVLGGVYATFAGYGDLEELLEIACETPRVGTVGAGSLWLYAGKGRHRGLPAGSIGAVVGRRMSLDAYLLPKVRGAYGRLIPSFGAQPTKALRGLDDLDTLGLSASARVQLANAGLNALYRNRRGFVSAFSARTRSSLPDYAHIDPVRFHTAGIGEARFWLEDEAIGDLNDATVKRSLCAEAHRLVFGPFQATPGVHVEVVPAPSGVPTEFALSMSADWPDPIERLAIQFTRTFAADKK